MTAKTLRQEADEIISNHVWFSTVPGFLPIPIVDMIGITAVQLDMIKQLCRLYEKEYNEQRGKAIVTSITTSLMGRVSGYALRSALKRIPVVGWIAGGVSLSLFAASSTYSVGQVFKEHFDEGGTLKDLNPESFRKFYQQQFEEWKNKAQGNNNSDKKDPPK